MNSKLKRTLAVFLVVLMLLTGAPLSGFVGLELGTRASAADVVDSGTCGDNLTWTLDSEGTLVISGEGEMDNYNWEEGPFAPWYNQRNSIYKVIIEDGVTTIGWSAFYSCEYIDDIIMAETVKDIGNAAFYMCGRNLKHINIPDGMTEIQQYTFSYCSITSVRIPDSVTKIDGWAFHGAHLISVTIPDSVRLICYEAFSRCGLLADVNISYGVQTIEVDAFSGCDSLKNVKIPESVLTIDKRAFGYDFWEDKMEDFTITGKPGTAAETYAIKNGFNFAVSCDHINTVEREAIKETCTEDGHTAGIFCNDCEAWLSGEVIKAHHIDEDGDGYCDDCGNAMRNVVDSGICGENLIWTLDSEGTLVISGEGEMEYDELPWDSDSRILNVIVENGVTSIGWCAFLYCSNLTSITIPNSVTSIGGYSFYSCSSLTSITIPDSVTSIGGNAFYNCSSLTNITLPESVKSIGENAFCGCEGLTSINVEKDNQYYSSIDGVLFHSDLQILIQYPAGKNELEYVIPDGVTSICDEAFRNCSSLTSITIPNGVTCILDGTFYSCSSLTSITIPDSVTIICNNAFRNCSSLTSITIPNSVTSISYGAFYGCDALKDVYYSGSEAEWNAIDVNNYDDSNEPLFNATIHFGKSEHTHAYIATVTAPTCTADGFTTYLCACGDKYTADTVKATGHKWNAGVVTTQPTEQKAGVKTYTCTVCKTTKTEAVAKLPHTHKYTAAVTKPTCTANGFTTYTCACGSKYTADTVKATGHKFGAWQTAKAATCTANGSKTRKCACGQTETAVINKLGHSYVNKVVKPTCTKDGCTLHTCSRCKASYKDNIVKATGHKTKVTTAKATLKKDGKTVTTCKVCGKTIKTVKIPKVTTVKLAKTTLAYNGKAQKAKLVIKDSKGGVLKEGRDYTLKYSKKTVKAIGEYSVKVTLKGKYSGTKTLKFKIVPATPKLTVKAGAKKAVLKWNKQVCTGYQIYYSTKKNGTYKKLTTVKNAKTVSYTAKKLKTGSAVYFKVRAYRKVGSANVFGAFSAVKGVKIK